MQEVARPFDVWWAERRSANKLHNAQAPAAVLQPLPLDVDGVTQVLTEFVRSEYVTQVCNHYNLEPTDYGQISGIFESVRLDDATLSVKLKRAVGETNEALLERLSKYLRARIAPPISMNVVTRDGVVIY